MIILKYSLAILCLLLAGCSFFSGSSQKEKESPALTEYEYTTDDMQSGEESATVPPPPPKRSAMALYMDSLGLVNVTDLDSTLVVKLMYTQADNFTGEVLYDNLTEAYLHPDAAYALIKAQKALKELHPSYSLIIYDAARPMSVQKKMWNVVKGNVQIQICLQPEPRRRTTQLRAGSRHQYSRLFRAAFTDGNPSRPSGCGSPHYKRKRTGT